MPFNQLMFWYVTDPFWHKMSLLGMADFIIDVSRHLGVVLESLSTSQAAVGMSISMHYHVCFQVTFSVAAVLTAFFRTGIDFTIMHFDVSYQARLILKGSFAIFGKTAMFAVREMLNSVILQLALEGESFSTSFTCEFKVSVAVFMPVKSTWGVKSLIAYRTS